MREGSERPGNEWTTLYMFSTVCITFPSLFPWKNKMKRLPGRDSELRGPGTGCGTGEVNPEDCACCAAGGRRSRDEQINDALK